MKITLSKKIWRQVGKEAGWLKIAQEAIEECDNCHKTFPVSELENINDKRLCPTCYEPNVTASTDSTDLTDSIEKEAVIKLTKSQWQEMGKMAGWGVKDEEGEVEECSKCHNIFHSKKQYKEGEQPICQDCSEYLNKDKG